MTATSFTSPALDDDTTRSMHCPPPHTLNNYPVSNGPKGTKTTPPGHHHPTTALITSAYTPSSSFWDVSDGHEEWPPVTVDLLLLLFPMR